MFFIISILILILGILIFFKFYESSLKKEFLILKKEINSKRNVSDKYFSYSKLKNFPEPLQRFFKYSNLIDKKIMKSTITTHTGADFILTEGKPSLKIKYIQCNYGFTPERLAFIDTSLYKIPFEGLDSYVSGVGCMKGMIGKTITLFDEKSVEMNKSSLVTVLAEGIVCPSIFLLGCIFWEHIDEYTAKATISDNGITVSGIFNFSKEGEITSFYTYDRYEIDEKGVAINTKWTAECGDYKTIEGINQPTYFKGIWNRESEDLVYFDCNNLKIEYKY